VIENFLEASIYARELFIDDEEILSIKEKALDDNVPIITDEVLAYMIYMIKLLKPKNGLEIGTAVGYSTYYLSKYMKTTTIEIDEERYNIAKENLKGRNVDMYLGDALEVLPSIDQKFDFIFIDAAKGKYKDFFDLCYEKLSDNGLVFIDNLLFRGYVTGDEYPKRYKTIVRNLKEFVKYLKKYNFVLLPFGDGVGLVRKDENEK
jgi:hypothetical protein